MLTDGIVGCFLLERVVVLSLKDLIILTRLKVILEYLEESPRIVFLAVVFLAVVRPVVVFRVTFLGVVVVVEDLQWKLVVVNH